MPPLVPSLASLLTALLLTTLVAMIFSWVWAVLTVQAGRPLLPPARPAEVPWGTGTVLALLATYFVVNVLTVQAYVFWTRRPAKAPFAFSEQMILMGVINGILLIAFPLVLHALSGALPEHFGLSRRHLGGQVRTGAVAFLLVTLPVNLINVLCARVWTPHQHPLELMIREESRGVFSLGALACLSFLTAVVLAPAAEELIFRGVLQNWLEKSVRRWGRARDWPAVAAEPGDDPEATEGSADLEPPEERPALPPNPYAPPQASLPDGRDRVPDPSGQGRAGDLLPVLLTSALFAAVHAPQWPAPIPIFFLALALGEVYRRTRSLVSSFVLHALFNGLSTLVLFQALLGGQLPAKKSVPPPASVALPAPARGPHGAPAPAPRHPAGETVH